MNPSKKRQALIEYLIDYIKEYLPDYKIENRVRLATLGALNRQQRISVMGENSEYGEVLSGTRTSESTQLNANTAPVLQGHNFIVNLWYSYKDNSEYDSSSQKTWDSVFLDGLIGHLEDTNLITYDEEKVFLFEPTDITDIIVPLESTGKELAHFLSFNIVLR